MTHEINTQGSDPVYQRAYRVPYASQGELDRQLDSMLKNDLVEEANSPWAAPVLIIDKKDGTKRLVVDFRILNRVTRKDRYPKTNITETLDSLGKAKFFTTLDLAASQFVSEKKFEFRGPIVLPDSDETIFADFNSFAETIEDTPNFRPTVGSILAALSSSQSLWMRGYVTKVLESSYNVYFVDYGNSDDSVVAVKPIPLSYQHETRSVRLSFFMDILLARRRILLTRIW